MNLIGEHLSKNLILGFTKLGQFIFKMGGMAEAKLSESSHWLVQRELARIKSLMVTK